MVQTKVVNITKTPILCLITFFENRAVNEITRKNIEESKRPQMAIWRTHISCWVPKVKNTKKTHTNTHTHTRNM